MFKCKQTKKEALEQWLVYKQTKPIFLKLYSSAQLACCTQCTEPLSISTLCSICKHLLLVQYKNKYDINTINIIPNIETSFKSCKNQHFCCMKSIYLAIISKWGWGFPVLTSIPSTASPSCLSRDSPEFSY